MRNVTRTVSLAAAALILGIGTAGLAIAQEDKFDCADFTTQAEAREQLLPGDPFWLDEDSDGIPCEELPTGEVVEQEAPPVAPIPQKEQDSKENFDIPSQGGEKDGIFTGLSKP